MSRKSVAAKSAIIAACVIISLATGISIAWAESFSPTYLEIRLLWSELNQWYNGYGEIDATGLKVGTSYLVRPVQFDAVYAIGLNGAWGFDPPDGGYHHWTQGSGNTHYILVDMISLDPPCACYIQLWKDGNGNGLVDDGEQGPLATIWVSGDTQ